MKCLNHKVYGRYSDADTNYDSIALFTFILDVVDLVCTAPISKESRPLYDFLCYHAYDESTNAMISVIDVSTMTLTSSIVLFKKPIILLNFPRSSFSLFHRLFIRNNMPVSMSVRPRFRIYPSLDVML